jgi:hypothetical protein
MEGHHMLVGAGSIRATGAILVLATCLALSQSAAQPPKPPEANKPLDLAPFLDLGKYYVTPVPPKKDPKTGFIVGGKNDTALIRGLQEIISRTRSSAPSEVSRV